MRGRLGYWKMVEERMIRAELAAEGVKPSISELSRRRTLNHAGDASYAEISRALAATARKAPSSEFTAEELAVLAERFAFANDPVSQSILSKVEARLARLPPSAPESVE